jgi:predicted TIM-barrel fold metal-dependent hydrolase
MPVVDADTHVDECESTWEFLEPAEEQFRPRTLVSEPQPNQPPGYHRSWQIGDNRIVRRIRDDTRTGTTVEARELSGVSARLAQMDAMNVDYHVIYPTLFIQYVTGDPAAQVALCKSYNRWLAQRSAESSGRLRWPVVVPTLDMDAATAELRWAKTKGACGVLRLASDDNRRITDPYFFPLYEEASALDLSICVHTGVADPPFSHSEVVGVPSRRPQMQLFGLNVVDACYSVVSSGVTRRFPKLRWGFIEAGSSWIPYVLAELWSILDRTSWAFTFKYSMDDVNDLFRENNVYVACQSHEDIPYLLRFGTEDHLMIGTDFSHADQSAEIGALDGIRRMAEEGRISKDQARKILEDNPMTFYGIG